MPSDIANLIAGPGSRSRAGRASSSPGKGLFLFLMVLPAVLGGAYLGLQKTGWVALPGAGQGQEEPLSQAAEKETLLSLSRSAPSTQPPVRTAPRPRATAPVQAAPITTAPGSSPATAGSTVARHADATAVKGASPSRRHEAPKPATTSAPSAKVIRADAKRIRKVDSYLQASDLDSASKALEKFLSEPHEDDYMAHAHYRLGIVKRLQKDEVGARREWEKVVKTYPATDAGRVAALAIADTEYVAACATVPQYQRWEGTRDLYSLAMGTDNGAALQPILRKRAVERLMQLNNAMLYGDAPYSCAFEYLVQGGDVLSRVAQLHGVDPQAIIVANRITNPNRIRAGKRLRIIKAECRIVVDKSDLTLTWYLDGKWVRQYACCVGPDNKTPVGTYRIEVKSIKPVWHDPKTKRQIHYGDPAYALGTRWLKLDEKIVDGLGIHGTSDPKSIPGRVSNGCIRLLNEHVEELYAFAHLDTLVIIQE